jgi:NTP pyrophosphatase (non-canonical NTP hydrolase)
VHSNAVSTTLWEGLVLARYLDGELDREEAIKHVCRTKVERAEREREVVEDDVDWGLNA